MENSQIALKLVLDELDLDSSIETIDDRKRVQKGIYLGQLSGVDLGYRFSWYLMGPYCSALTKDYYAMTEAMELGDVSWQQKTLYPALKDKLKALVPLLKLPGNVKLSVEQWLELIASYHFLRKVSGKSHIEAEETIKLQKPALKDYIDVAKTALAGAGFLP